MEKENVRPSGAEMTDATILARQERMAELEREIADCENMIAWHPNDWETRDKVIKLRSELSRLRNEGGGDVLYETMREIEHYENHGLIPETVAWREAVDEAIKFIADEYRDPSYEPEGEWLPPEARRVHRKLCEALRTLSAKPTANRSEK